MPSRSIRYRQIAGLAALLVLPAPTGAAMLLQDTSRSGPTAAKASAFQQFLDSVRSDDSLQVLKRERIVPPGCSLGAELGADSAVMQRCRDAWAQYFAYQRFGHAHREQVFRWQLLSSKITFVVVIALVAAGVFFSWIQFQAELPLRRPQGGGTTQLHERVARESEAAEATGQETVPHLQSIHQIKASTSGIEVSSPVLGVIILSLSLLFFYLYLKFVYPIYETF